MMTSDEMELFAHASTKLPVTVKVVENRPWVHVVATGVGENGKMVEKFVHSFRLGGTGSSRDAARKKADALKNKFDRVAALYYQENPAFKLQCDESLEAFNRFEWEPTY